MQHKNFVEPKASRCVRLYVETGEIQHFLQRIVRAQMIFVKRGSFLQIYVALFLVHYKTVDL